MMPIKSAVVSLILLINLPSRSFAQTSPLLPEPDKDPFVGTWKANADKSRPKLDKGEASYIRTVSREGDDRVFSSRSKRHHSAGFAENHYKIRCDGSLHRVQCGDGSCMTSCKYVAANRVEGESVNPDGKTLYWAEEVSSDGRETRVYGYKNKARTKLSRVVVLDRVN